MTSDVNEKRGHLIEELRAGSSPDVLVVGGGITGVGIALDLAARGLKPLVIDKGDWGSATSSASSRLIHGGLRYLEHFEFSLVRDSCLERALLLDNAAGFVWPEEFHFPVMRGDRIGAGKLMLGLWVYTALATPRALGLPTRRSAAALEERIPGIDRGRLKGGGSYIDAATDDSRLTLAIRKTAEREGAMCLSRVQALSIRDENGGPTARLRDLETGVEFDLKTMAVVLAGGPSTDALRSICTFNTGDTGKTAAGEAPWTAPTRGSHIVVPRAKLPTDGAVIFTSAVDGRVMFLIPWPNHTVVGTTDIDDEAANPKDGSPRTRPVATAAEVQYLVDSAAALVPASKLTTDDVISTWAGLRPLLAAPPGKGPSERSREERIERAGNLFTIAGGKLTGYRSAAEKVGKLVTSHLGAGNTGKASPTRELRLDGALAGTIPRPAWSRLVAGQVQGLNPLAVAWDGRYGAQGAEVRAFCASRPGGTEPLDERTIWGEVDWAVHREDVRGLVDYLFRRSDVGLGERGKVSELIPSLAERIGRELSWSEQRIAVEIDRATEELDRRHAWRDE